MFKRETTTSQHDLHRSNSYKYTKWRYAITPGGYCVCTIRKCASSAASSFYFYLFCVFLNNHSGRSYEIFQVQDVLAKDKLAKDKLAKDKLARDKLARNKTVWDKQLAIRTRAMNNKIYTKNENNIIASLQIAFQNKHIHLFYYYRMEARCVLCLPESLHLCQLQHLRGKKNP